MKSHLVYTDHLIRIELCVRLKFDDLHSIPFVHTFQTHWKSYMYHRYREPRPIKNSDAITKFREKKTRYGNDWNWNGNGFQNQFQFRNMEFHSFSFHVLNIGFFFSPLEIGLRNGRRSIRWKWLKTWPQFSQSLSGNYTRGMVEKQSVN